MIGEPQIIRASSGEELVVLTRSAYDELVASASGAEIAEDAADLAVARAARAEWETAGKPVVPLKVLRRVRAGDTYLQAFRAEKGLTQAQLATQSGIPLGYLSELETSRRMPDDSTRTALARALDIHPIWLSGDAPKPSGESGEA